MPTYQHVSEARPYAIWPGAVARAIAGERVQVAVVELEPNLDVPEHQHANEQVGFVLLGSITMVIAGERRQLGAGDMYAIPGGVKHSALTGGDGATVVDVFDPPREDWERLERLPPAPGRWPLQERA